MYVNLNKCLIICSGPKDIARCPIINSLKEEANLKLKSWKVHHDGFKMKDMLDVNIVIFQLKHMTEDDKNEIIAGANETAIHVFGLNDDTLLHQLIPLAESYERWVSVCEYCVNDTVFQLEGNIICRQCMNMLKSKDKNDPVSKDTASGKRKFNPDSSGSSDSSSVQIIEPKRSNMNITPPTMTTIINDTPNTTFDSEIDSNE